MIHLLKQGKRGSVTMGEFVLVVLGCSFWGGVHLGEWLPPDPWIKDSPIDCDKC